MRHAAQTLLCAALVASLTACAPSPPPPLVEQAIPAEFPGAHYRQARERGADILEVDPTRSLVVVEVRRAGALAALGHDHVVASRNLRGYVDPAVARADLYVDLTRLSVDEAKLRAEAGLDTRPSEAAIEGTRQNMLGRVLDAEHHPFALIRVQRREAAMLDVSITLHGEERAFAVPAQFEILPHGMAVSGALSFNQTDFGIVPMSVLGGALQVRDRVDLRFRVQAMHMAP